MLPSSLRVKALALTSIFCAASANLQAQFIDLSGNDVKVVYKEVDYNGQTVTEATASKRTGTLANGNGNGHETETIATRERSRIYSLRSHHFLEPSFQRRR